MGLSKENSSLAQILHNMLNPQPEPRPSAKQAIADPAFRYLDVKPAKVTKPESGSFSREAIEASHTRESPEL